jgi:gamma-glutamylcyclotransferase (GGCT)/AIG2-like uncharacterized protein YtfP
MSQDTFSTFRSFIQTNKRPGSTPDLARLNKKNGHLIFIYDAMKRKHKWHKSFLQDAEFITGTFTQDPIWTLFNFHGMYPVMFRASDQFKWAQPTRVYGEIYLVTSRQLAEIDEMQANTEDTYRAQIQCNTSYTIDLPEGTKKCNIRLRCWTHLGILSEWKTAILEDEDMVLTDMYYLKNKKDFDYYIWTKEEEDRRLERLNKK